MDYLDGIVKKKNERVFVIDRKEKETRDDG